jgi:hypothetical protein
MLKMVIAPTPVETIGGHQVVITSLAPHEEHCLVGHVAEAGGALLSAAWNAGGSCDRPDAAFGLDPTDPAVEELIARTRSLLSQA